MKQVPNPCATDYNFVAFCMEKFGGVDKTPYLCKRLKTRNEHEYPKNAVCDRRWEDV